MELTPGASLGPYRLVERAGPGGMAEVWRAYQPSLERYVAIKVLPRHLAARPGYVERFRREALAISRLDHPNILHVHDFGEQDGFTFMAMPFVAGGTLADHLERAWSAEEALGVLEPLAAALDYAHAQGIVHRDVKPSNVLMTPARHVLLSDFGVARMVEEAGGLTQVGAVIGTPAYMAPEQAAGQPAGPASDLYSLGIIAYELLTGRVPFEAETPAAVALAHVYKPLPPPRSINPAVSETVEAVLLKALAKDPLDRYRSGQALMRAMGAAARPVPGVSPKPAVSMPMRSLPPRVAAAPRSASGRPRTLVGLASGGLLVAAVGVGVGVGAWYGGLMPPAAPGSTVVAVAPTETARPAPPTPTPRPVEASPVASVVASPTRPATTATPLPRATPLPTATPTEAQAVAATLGAIAPPWARGDWDAVIARLKPLQARYPANPVPREKLYAAYVGKGEALERNEQPVEAREPYTAATQLDPGRPEARTRLRAIGPVGRALAWRIFRWRPGPSFDSERLQGHQDGEVYTIQGKAPRTTATGIPSMSITLGPRFVIQLSTRIGERPGGLMLALYESRQPRASQAWLTLSRHDDGTFWLRFYELKSTDTTTTSDTLAQFGPNPAFLAPDGTPNLVRIEANDGNLTLSVNGTRLWTGRLRRPITWVSPGIVTYSQPNATIDLLEYLVYEPS